MSKYLIDSDVLIQAKNLHYGMDFCPAFWDWLIAASGRGTVYSIEAIFDELTPKSDGDPDEDDLSRWVRGVGNCLFLPHDKAMADCLPTVSEWANGQGSRYRPEAISQFLGGADYYLVAYALAHRCTVVTNEVTDNSPRRIKIPDVCAGLGVA